MSQRQSLRDVRRIIGLTQQTLASRLGVKANEISRAEHQRVLKTSTLGKIAKAMGGELRVTIVFTGGVAYDLSPFSSPSSGRDEILGALEALLNNPRFSARVKELAGVK